MSKNLTLNDDTSSGLNRIMKQLINWFVYKSNLCKLLKIIMWLIECLTFPYIMNHTTMYIYISIYFSSIWFISYLKCSCSTEVHFITYIFEKVKFPFFVTIWFVLEIHLHSFVTSDTSSKANFICVCNIQFYDKLIKLIITVKFDETLKPNNFNRLK